MTRFSTLLASAVASVLLLAGTAMAVEVTTTPTASTCTASPPTTWSSWGVDPYASSVAQALTDAKLDKALQDAVDAGCMPVAVAQGLKAAIRANPNGTLVVLSPGFHLDMMETGHAGPMFNVAVGRYEIAPGQVKAVEAKAWAVQYEGRVYTWFLPLPCFNWSLSTTQVPQPAEPDCVEILVPAKAGDSVIFARYGDYAPSACDAFQAPGDTVWRPQPTRCPEMDCVPLPVVNNLRVVQSGGWRVTGAGGWYRLRISQEAAQNGLVYLCLKQGTRTSCGTKVQYDDYQSGRAIVRYSLSAATLAAESSPSTRLLYWSFDLAKDCPTVRR